MNETELNERSRAFALRILKLIDALPERRSGRILAQQLGRSGTSVAANYRAACRSRSTAEMISRLSVVEEEADESELWPDMIAAHGLLKPKAVAPLREEADQLTAIMVASRRTLQRGNRESKIQNRKSR